MLRLFSTRRLWSAPRGLRVTAAAAAAATGARRSVALSVALLSAQRRQYSITPPEPDNSQRYLRLWGLRDVPLRRIGRCVGAVALALGAAGLATAAALSYYESYDARLTVTTMRSKILASTAQPNLTPGVGVVQSAFGRELDARYGANEFLYVDGPPGSGKSVCVLTAALQTKRPVLRVSLKSKEFLETQLSTLLGVDLRDTLVSAHAMTTREHPALRTLRLFELALKGLPEEKRPVLIVDDADYLGTGTLEERTRQKNLLSGLGQLASQQRLLSVVLVGTRSFPHARAVPFRFAARADVAAAMAAGDANGNRAFTSEREITTVLNTAGGNMRVVNDCVAALRTHQSRLPAGATLSADARLQVIQHMLAARQADATKQLDEALNAFQSSRPKFAVRLLTALSKAAAADRDPCAVSIDASLARGESSYDAEEVLSSLSAIGVVVRDNRFVRWATPMAYTAWQQRPLHPAYL